MPKAKTTNGAAKSKPTREDVRRACEEVLAPVFGSPLPKLRVRLGAAPLPKLEGTLPEIERRAQEHYARARRELRALLAAVPENTACGPCSAWLHEHRDAVKAIVAAPGEKGAHWRQHSATRTSATQRTVDVWGSMRMTIAGVTRALSARELACISLLNGAPLSGEDVEGCIERERNAIRAERGRVQKRTR